MVGGATGRLGRAVAAAACLCTAAAASPALAGSSITVNASYQIAPSCGVSVQTPFAAQNFGADGSATAQALVDCNTGFVITATSQKGAIKTATAAALGFVNTIPYALTLNVPRDSGLPVQATCQAAAMTGQGSCVVNSGGVAAIAKTATLTTQWSLNGQRPIAGAYSDVITISIAGQP